MEKFFLSIEHLNVHVGGEHVLRDINLKIFRGQQWAIVGPSGSGKTVLAQTLCGKHFFTGRINSSFGGPENFYSLIRIVEQQHHFKDITNRRKKFRIGFIYGSFLDE